VLNGLSEIIRPLSRDGEMLRLCQLLGRRVRPFGFPLTERFR